MRSRGHSHFLETRTRGCRDGSYYGSSEHLVHVGRVPLNIGSSYDLELLLKIMAVVVVTMIAVGNK